jgi:carbamoyl-phosphate synthase large subunit
VIGKEAEVDLIADGQGGCLIPGIMEHIERAGVHSGDSMAVYPPQTLSKKTCDQIVDYSIKLSKALNVIGLMNIQFVIDGDEAQVIEVNPRASRTAPYLSKITGVPMVQVATNAILGQSIESQGFTHGLQPIQPSVAVKAPVFSFAKLTGVDINLGPEMKSTGEVLGIDLDYPRALYKALIASGMNIRKSPHGSSVLVTVADSDKQEALPIALKFAELGFHIYATSGTAKFLNQNGLAAESVKKISEGSPNLVDLIRGGKISLVINTVSKDRKAEQEGLIIRRATVEHSIPCLTSLDTANAMQYAIAAHKTGADFTVQPIDQYLAKA